MLIRRLRSVDLRDESGFTLPELLTAIIIGLLIIFAAFDLLDTTLSVGSKVTKRVDATQRGRTALDRITRDLRSQVCLPGDTPVDSLIGASDNSVDIYADLTDGSGARPPQRRTITFNPTARTLSESIYTPTGSPGSYTFPSAPTSTQTLLTDVVQSATTPVFQFYPLDATPDDNVDPTAIDGSTALDANELDTVVRIAVTFKALPTGGSTTSSGSAVLQDQVFRRAVDPNSSDPTPGCS
jgi:prepilin-type N-terminal cleavage/methylation domain-containing protein